MFVRRSTARMFALPAAVIGLCAVTTGPALAHVTITPGAGEAGSYTVATLSVPHGCEGSATTRVTIKIPEALYAVTPTRNALWSVKKNLVTLPTPVQDAHGNEITERVDSVVYTAHTPLPDGYRDAFELSFRVPEDAGEDLVFPTIQTCVRGSTAWIEVATDGAAEPEHPAPSMTITAATGAGEGHSDAVEGAAEDTVTARDDAASKGLGYTGLGVGALGLLLAGVAVAQGRKRA